MAAMDEFVQAAAGGETYDQQIGEGKPGGQRAGAGGDRRVDRADECDRRRRRSAQPYRDRLRRVRQSRRPRGGLRVGNSPAVCRADSPADRGRPARPLGAALRPAHRASVAIHRHHTTDRRAMCELCTGQRAPTEGQCYSARAFDPPVSRNVNGLACRSPYDSTLTAGVVARSGSRTSGDAVGRMFDSLRLRYEDGLVKKVVGRFWERGAFFLYYSALSMKLRRRVPLYRQMNGQH